MSKILIICTSAAVLAGGEEAGAWSEEITAPYYTFADAGSKVTIASIAGGKVPISQKSLKPEFFGESDKRFHVVGAVCHGPCGLVNAKNEEGEPLVKGKNVTGFTDEEERMVGLQDQVDFLLETKFKEQGGKFACADAWQPFAVADGRLVTGQNPTSATKAAALVLAALKGQ
eukprot:jgi/Mesvir1/14696/Mv05353-RA.1